MRRVGASAPRAAPQAKAKRPSLPGIFLCSLGMWASCATAYASLECCSSDVCLLVGGFGVFLVLLLGTALVWMMRIGCKVSVLGPMLLGVSLGIMCSGSAAALQHARYDALDAKRYSDEICVVCTEDSVQGAYGSSCEALIAQGPFAGARITIKSDGVESAIGRELRAGDVVTGQCTLVTPGDESADYFWSNGLAASARINAPDTGGLPGVLQVPFHVRNRAIDELLRQREGMSERFEASTDMLLALLCGYRCTLSQTETYRQFQTAGLAHLVAVSGAHLSLMAGIAASVLKALRVRRRYSIGIQVTWMLAYVLFTGMPVSAVRACVMSLCCLLSWYSKRRSSSLSALGACIVAMVAMQPVTACSASFVLSAGSTMGILLFAPYFSQIGERWLVRMPRAMRDSLALTFSAGMCTQLYAAALFCQMSLISPISNCLIAPFFSVVCVAGMLLLSLSLLLPFASGIALLAASVLASFITVPVELISSFPYACIPVDLGLVPAVSVSACICVLIYLAWPLPRRGAFPWVFLFAVCVCAVFAVSATRSGEDEIIMLDVGQGDAIVVRSQGSTMMIDTGTEDEALRRALARNAVYRIDSLFITHPDDDHCGSLGVLCSLTSPQKIYVPADLLTCDDSSCIDLRKRIGESMKGGVPAPLEPGDCVSCGAFDLTVVWPDSYKENGGNADSLCLLCEYDGDDDGKADWTVLLCGDAESDTLRTLISQRRVSDIDVLKVGHHGSKASVDGEVICALDPEVSLISVGADNDYGHPSQQTLTTLEEEGSKVFRTDEQGDLTCCFSRERIEVRTLR